VSRLEEAAVGRWSGARIITASLAFGVAGVLPLALYVRLGPADGNPVGLGLLAVVAVPVAVLGMAVGLVELIVQRLARRGE
jgi:hypothetical protein